MTLNLKSAIEAACSPSPWDLGNKCLYELCEKNPLHKDIRAVVAKVGLRGTSNNPRFSMTPASDR
jgi:hypothetical protein